MIKCKLCNDSKLVCPGCTGGEIPDEFFASCGQLIRCPLCVGYTEARQDTIKNKTI